MQHMIDDHEESAESTGGHAESVKKGIERNADQQAAHKDHTDIPNFLPAHLSPPHSASFREIARRPGLTKSVQSVFFRSIRPDSHQIAEYSIVFIL